LHDGVCANDGGARKLRLQLTNHDHNFLAPSAPPSDLLRVAEGASA